MDSRAKMIVLAVAALLLIGGACAAWWYPRIDPQVTKVEALQKEMWDARETMTDEQRREKWDQLRAETDKLTDEQKRAMWEKRGEEFRKAQQAKITAFNKLPRGAERNAFLDKEIAEMEKWRERGRQRGGERGERGQRGGQENQGQANRPGGGQGGGGGPGGPFGGGASGGGGRGGPPGGGGVGPGGGGFGGGGSGWGGGGGGNPTTRNDRRRERLDSSTAIERAQTVEYMDAMRIRRRELGLPDRGGRRF